MTWTDTRSELSDSKKPDAKPLKNLELSIRDLMNRIENLIGILTIVLATVLGFAACTTKAELNPINTTAENVAIRGFDTVSYFTAEKAIEGDPQFSLIWKGAKWYFSSAENRDLFSKFPEKYAPQYGGYCSYAVGRGYTANGDPKAWKKVDGKLYLNYNEDVQKMWEQEQADLINQADQNWQKFQTQKPEHKGN